MRRVDRALGPAVRTTTMMMMMISHSRVVRWCLVRVRVLRAVCVLGTGTGTAGLLVVVVVARSVRTRRVFLVLVVRTPMIPRARRDSGARLELVGVGMGYGVLLGVILMTRRMMGWRELVEGLFAVAVLRGSSSMNGWMAGLEHGWMVEDAG